MEEQPVVIYEDNHLLGLNKPTGWLVQSDHTGDFTTLEWGKRYIKDRYQKPGNVFLVPVHRIDRPVGGTVIFSRTSKSLSRINERIRNRSIDKTYIALTQHAPARMKGHLEHYILKRSGQNKVETIPMRKRPPAKAKKASLTYRLVAEIEGLYLLVIDLHTGRPHQIRAQLSAIGCPVYGDIKYGADAPLSDASIGLHSLAMTFAHPTKKDSITIRSEPLSGTWWKPFNSFIKTLPNG